MGPPMASKPLPKWATRLLGVVALVASPILLPVLCAGACLFIAWVYLVVAVACLLAIAKVST